MTPVRRSAIVFVVSSVFLGVSSRARRKDPSTIPAASCNLSDVRAAVAKATLNGDAVTIPAGTCTWTGSLSVTTGIAVIGAGTDATVIQDDINQASIFDIKLPSSSSFFRVSSMTLEPSSKLTGAMATKAAISTVQGTCDSSGCSEIRFDHLTLTGWTYHGYDNPANTVNGFYMKMNDVFGVLDHLTLSTTTGGELANVGYGSWGAVGAYGDNSWAQPDTFGTGQALYIEDSTITDSNASSVFSLTDTDFFPYGGGRLVVRHNTLTNALAYMHGTESTGRARGGRQIEVYDNQMLCTNRRIGCYLVTLRSGTGLIFNNTISTSGSGFIKPVVALGTYRTFAGFTPWGWCGGQGPYDDNDGTVYASGTISSATVSSGKLTVTDTTQSWSANRWVDTSNPYSIVDTRKSHNGFPAYEIDASTSNSVTADNYGLGQAFWTDTLNAGDSYEILRAAVCIDQPGRGGAGATLLSRSTPSPTGWVNEPLDPVYEWGDTVTGTLAGLIVGSDTYKVIANRDFYYQNPSFDGTSGTGTGTLADRPPTCTPRVAFWAKDANSGKGELYVCTATNTWTASYTPYTYPHPLQTATSIAAPKNLTVTSVH
jgi:hypothetical protein